ncbi:MAG TPA: nitronate monooxygenase [Gemmatimonadaceae bacterium]|nr:nitronate monooxygenase [Gemmatimonadaceae bacterium]
MSSSRREFLGQAAAVAAGLGAKPFSLSAQPTAMPTARARAFMDLFGLKYPIGNAGMGRTATPDLTIAVANAGALGAVGTGIGVQADFVRQRVSQTKSGTSRPFAVNYLLFADPVTLPVALDAGAPIIQFSWGIPTSEMAAAIRSAGAKMGVQISGAAGARRALDVGADYLICQGTEAGGHVQGTRALYDVLPAVIEEAKTIPVLAAGGIANGAHMRRALIAGASGVLIGTRFLVTKEAGSHEEHKRAIMRAAAADTVLTVCFADGFPNSPHRVLRNKTLEMWEAAGCPQPGKRPGEGDILTTDTVTGEAKRRYSSRSTSRNDQGAVLEMALYAGEGVDAIRDIPSAGELVERLWKECVAAV